MTNATNLIHRLAELRAGVLCRIRLNWTKTDKSFRAFWNAADHCEHVKLRASLAAIDSCADAAEVLREVRHSTRRIYRRLISPGAREELTIGGTGERAMQQAA
jgi:urease accessory protein UreF